MNNPILKIIVKLILAVILLVCLLKMPYGYYQIVRVAGLVMFGYLAYTEYSAKKYFLFILFLASAILFNPIQKIILGRELWKTVDVVLAVILVITIIIENLQPKK